MILCVHEFQHLPFLLFFKHMSSVRLSIKRDVPRHCKCILFQSASNFHKAFVELDYQQTVNQVMNLFLQAVLYFTGEALEDEVRHSLFYIFCPFSSLYERSISLLIFHIFEFHPTKCYIFYLVVLFFVSIFSFCIFVLQRVLFFFQVFFKNKKRNWLYMYFCFCFFFLGVADDVTEILWLHTTSVS